MIVCYSLNYKYYDLFEVSLRSLLDFNSVTKVYVLNSMLSDEFIKRAEVVCDNRCDIEFIHVDPKMFRDIEMKYLGVESYYRLLLPELIKEDKVWYIDVDTLILGSIEQPYYEKVDFMVAAVPKLFQDSLETQKNSLGMSKDAQYFNSGVLLLNLVKLKNDGLFKGVIHWININFDIIGLADQDGLNAILNGQYYKLDKSYNVTTELVKEIKNPKIVHFTGEFKPNLFLFQHPYKKKFMRYFSYNKKSFDVSVNINYLKKYLRSYIFKMGSKIPFLKRLYGKLRHYKL